MNAAVTANEKISVRNGKAPTPGGAGGTPTSRPRSPNEMITISKPYTSTLVPTVTRKGACSTMRPSLVRTPNISMAPSVEPNAQP